jgi:peptidyl-prolyl cis-trans isomerase C
LKTPEPGEQSHMKPSKNLFMLSAVFLAITVVVSAWAVDLAKVNDRAITDKDIQMALSGLNDGQRTSFLKDINNKRQILSNLIDQEILAQEAEKEKLDQDQEYKDALATFRKQFLANRILQKNLGAQLNDKAARKYYDQHKIQYSTDQVNAMHILLTDEAQAQDILKKAKGPDVDFQALAEKFSKDPSAKNNRGDLGIINRNSPFVKEFKDAAFSAKEGAIVGPVKTAFGYHIIKVAKKKVGKALEYDEVELRVKGDLRQEMIEDYVNKIKQQAKVSVEDKALEKL